MSLRSDTVRAGTAQDLLRFCESERDWALETVLSLARIESPTLDKAAVDRCGHELVQQMEAIGGRVSRLEQRKSGDHLRAEFGAGEKQVLVVGHFDTVWPVGQIGRMPVELRDGCLFGPGVFDMKGGIAIGLLAARALSEVTDHRGRLIMLWTSDEECGSVTSRALIEDEARRSEAAFVLEPALDSGAVKTRRKGCGEFQLSVKGVAAHAGIEPDKGASAVHELAAQIVDLQRVGTLSPGISVNVGVITGGTRPNVVAEEAAATIDVRVSTAEEARKVVAAVRERVPTIAGTEILVDGGINRPPLERTDGVARLYERASVIAAGLGRTLAEGGTGGGSDGNFTSAVGTPTLDGLGAVGAGAHAVHEHIEVECVAWRGALLAALLADTLAGD